MSYDARKVRENLRRALTVTKHAYAYAPNHYTNEAMQAMMAVAQQWREFAEETRAKRTT
jgi:hypothetical protein